MNYSELGQVNVEKQPSYTDEIVRRLRDLADALHISSKEIYQNLERLVGQDDINVESTAKSESPVNDSGLYGTLHLIIDELEKTARLNQDNSLKLNRIV